MKRFFERLKKLKGLDVALLLTFGFFILFHLQMMDLYREYGSIPESYAMAVVGATLGEAGICGWIRNVKEQERERGRRSRDEEDNG